MKLLESVLNAKVSKKIELVSVLKKHGRNLNFHYTVDITLVTETKRFMRETEQSVKLITAIVSPKGLFIKSDGVEKEDREFLKNNRMRVFYRAVAENKRLNLKSEDECCNNPDLEKVNIHYSTNVLKKYVDNNPKYERIKSPVSYDNMKTIELIVLEEDIAITIDRYHRKTVTEYACLNCKTCFIEYEQDLIDTFEKMVEEHVKREKRKIQAKEICRKSKEKK